MSEDFNLRFWDLRPHVAYKTIDGRIFMIRSVGNNEHCLYLFYKEDPCWILSLEKFGHMHAFKEVPHPPSRSTLPESMPHEKKLPVGRPGQIWNERTREYVDPPRPDEKKKRTVTLYRYTWDNDTCIFQTDWKDIPVEHHPALRNGWRLLKTESKNVEIEGE